MNDDDYDDFVYEICDHLPHIETAIGRRALASLVEDWLARHDDGDRSPAELASAFDEQYVP